MNFDPDAYLADAQKSQPSQTNPFDPDAYLESFGTRKKPASMNDPGAGMNESTQTPATIPPRRGRHVPTQKELIEMVVGDTVPDGYIKVNKQEPAQGSELAKLWEGLEKQFANETNRTPIRDTLRDVASLPKEVPKALARGVENFEAAVGPAISAVGDYVDVQQAQWNRVFYGSSLGQWVAARKRRKYVKEHGSLPPAKIQSAPQTVGDRISEFGEEIYDFWNEAANTGWEKRDPEIYGGSFIENPSLTRVVGGASESAPTMVGAMALSASGHPGLGAALLAGSESAPIYIEAKRAGASEADAFSYALLSGVGTAALERVGLDAVMGKNPAIDKVIQKMGAKWYTGALVNFTVEGSQEAGQEIYQNAVAMGWDEDRELLEGALEAGLSGGLLGSGSSMSRTVYSDYMSKQAKNAKGLTADQIDQVVRENMRPAKLDPAIYAQLQGEQPAVPVSPLPGGLNRAEVEKEINRQLNEEERTDRRAARIQLEQDMEGDPDAFDKWLAQVEAEEAEAQRKRLDPNRVENLRFLAKHVQQTEGIEERDAMQQVARMRYDLRQKLLAELHGLGVPAEGSGFDPDAYLQEAEKKLTALETSEIQLGQSSSVRPEQTGKASASSKTEAAQGLEGTAIPLRIDSEPIKTQDTKPKSIQRHAEIQGSPAQDLSKEARGRAQGGFVSAPDAQGMRKMAKSMGRFARRWLTASAGLDAKTRNLNLEKMQAQEAARVEGLFTRKAFEYARKQLAAEHGRDKVQSALESVVYGDMTPAHFASTFGLPADHAAVQALEGFNTVRESRSAALAAMLEKTGNPSMAERVRENETYVSRFYLKHAMGDEFTPKPEDYRSAVSEIRAGIEDLIERIGKRASAAAGKNFQKSVVDYLNTGDEATLTGLSKSRRGEITALGRSFSKISQVVDQVEAAGDGVSFALNVAALEDAARSTVDFYLSRDSEGSHGSDTANLRKRFLGEAFRKLYGEVRDPIHTAAATAENQAKLLAHLTFFNRLAMEAENVSWSRMPSNELGTTKRLDNDRKRYGLLAGAYVTPDLHRAIHGEESAQGLSKVYRSTLGTMRLLKLVGPKTIARNYSTALTGFALGSGDMMRPGYWKWFNHGSALVRDVVVGKPEALAELRDLVEAGVFSFHGNTQMEEVRQLLTLSPGKKLEAGVSKLGDLYSMIDLPTKAAAYYAVQDALLHQGIPVLEARERAAEHVQKFYQNPRALPRVAAKISRLPVSDYPGYFFDAIRIRANQTAHAVRSARSGDLVPALGLVMSGMLTVGLAYGFGSWGRELWRKARRGLRRDDKEMVSEAELAKRQEQALRSFMPDYYENAPLISWKEKQKDGTLKLYYTVTGGNGAFPVEDMLIGALQGSDNPQDFFNRFGTSVAENRLGPGMLLSALYKFGTGDDLAGGFHTTGIVDVLGRQRPDKNKVFAKASIRLLSDVYGGQFGSKLMQLQDLQQKKKAGAEPVAGSYVPYQSYAGVLGSMIDPARTYEIEANEAARMVRNRIAPYREGIGVAKGMAGNAIRAEYKQNAATDSQQAEALMGQEARKEYIEQLGRIIAQARIAFDGVLNESHYEAIVKDALPGVSRREMGMILDAVQKYEVPDYQPQPMPTELQRLMGR